LIIAKRKARALNPIQFNALAIVFLLGLMPFAVAIITNSGSSSEGEYKDSKATESPGFFYGPYSYWLENGGDNYSGLYYANDPNDIGANRTYVENGYCPARSMTIYPCFEFGGGLTYPGEVPMQGMTIPKSHYYTSQTYIGSSGNGPFSWFLQPRFIDNIEEGAAIDKFKISFIDTNVDHNCGSSIFTNISFEGKIQFLYNNRSKIYDNFDFQTSNKYEYSSRLASWTAICQIGFETIFDLTGFETLELEEFVGGDWNNVSMVLTLDNFERKDGQNFGSTDLPFAGGQEFFTLGIEHQEVNPVEAGFIIKTGTIGLAVITFVLAIASTPYWDPFRNAVKGALD